MTASNPRPPREGLRIARLLMVLSSFSPLFILWAIRGNSVIGDRYFIPGCAALCIVPNVALWLRIWTAKRKLDKRQIVVGAADDHRDHILVSLFAMLLPFYSEDIDKWRYLSASLFALAFIIFLFWHLNLHYMNLIFAMFGYRVFTVSPPADGNLLTGRTRQAVITRRVTLSPGDTLVTFRVSNSVYLEIDS